MGKPAKARQVARFASWLGARRGPTLVGIDRNAPKWERHELAHDEWWNSSEPLLYGPARSHDLRDVFRDNLKHHPEQARQVLVSHPNGPLAMTHVRRGIPCRYDAIYASPEFRVIQVEHRWEDAVTAGSDHAMVTATLELCH